MKIGAVICEFNPFHKGHKHLFDSMRQNGITHIAAIMSGNFVQRGECAVINKFRRAESALANGADIVIELPITKAVSSAQRFAEGGVAVAKEIGADELWFGSECGNIKKLTEISFCEQIEDIGKAVSKLTKAGITGAKAFSMALVDIYGKEAEKILYSPNNVLGIEYIRAIRKLKADIEPVTVQRIGATHDSILSSGGYASSSMMRNIMKSQSEIFSLEEYTDSISYNVLEKEIKSGYAPASMHYGERAVIAKLRTMTSRDLSDVPDVTEGLENRLYEAILRHSTLEEITDFVKTKRYTHSRIRRIILCAFLGITKELQELPISYIKPLCFNQNGTDILKNPAIKLPIITSPSKALKTLEGDALELFSLELRATDLWGVFTPKIYPCGSDFYNFIKKDSNSI